jgi:hypothetical protein
MTTEGADPEGYQGLFRGSARLGVLCAGLGVPWESVAPVVGSFSERFKDYFELSIDPGASALGLMTKGEGQPFVYRVTRMMEEAGVPEEGLRRFLVRAKYFEARNVFFKVEADSRGLREFSTYFRRRPAIDVAHACLADSGADAHGIGLMEAVAEVLEKKTVHFLGTAATPSGDLMEKVYFSQEGGIATWERLRSVAMLCGLSDADWAPMAAQADALSECTVFASLGYRNGELMPGFKLDVHNVTPGIVHGLLSTDAERERADLARVSSGNKRHSYVGFRLVPDKPLRIKTYNLG